MKKDSLREFVSANRDSFDDQQPGSDMLDKLHAKLKLEHTPVVPQPKIITFSYWWAAAILITGICYFTFFDNNTKNKNTTAHKKEVITTFPSIAADKETLGPTQRPEGVALTESEKKQPTEIMQKRVNVNLGIDPKRKIPESSIVVNDLAEALKSESSSTRLSAILGLGEGNSSLSDQDLHILFSTMSNDESSNVRLAVLDVLKKQQTQPLVEDFILQSIVKQDDPVVQMELLSSLSSHEAVKIKKQLLDLSQDPSQIDLVREQAYAVLFRSNINI